MNYLFLGPVFVGGNLYLYIDFLLTTCISDGRSVEYINMLKTIKFHSVTVINTFMYERNVSAFFFPIHYCHAIFSCSCYFVIHLYVVRSVKEYV